MSLIIIIVDTTAKAIPNHLKKKLGAASEISKHEEMSKKKSFFKHSTMLD